MAGRLSSNPPSKTEPENNLEDNLVLSDILTEVLNEHDVFIDEIHFINKVKEEVVPYEMNRKLQEELRNEYQAWVCSHKEELKQKINRYKETVIPNKLLLARN